MQFEWDEQKRLLVKQKHGVDPAHVGRIFESPHIADFDAEHSADEDRWRAIGMLDGKIVVISYTIRGEIIRLITARRATVEEEALYLEEFFGEPF